MKDRLVSIIAWLFQRPLRMMAHLKGPEFLTAKELERQGIAIYQHHYYHPFITEDDLARPLDLARNLPGIKLDAAKQIEFICSLLGRDEICEFASAENPDSRFRYDNGLYGYGDADVLYAMIRTFKPKQFIEIGSGQSTKVVRLAIEQNTSDDDQYVCRHICIEPYEQPWLEDFGVEVIREKAEHVDLSLFQSLGANDICFIDSSHIIRPQGDVLFEYLTLLPLLAPGVFVHVHDIFTPADYPKKWVIDRKLLWNEQYLLEAFLSMNQDYEVLIACNWLANRFNSDLKAALPGFALQQNEQPGSFWIRHT